MRINMKLDATQENKGFSLIPDGDYTVTVTKIKEKKTSTNRDMTVLELTIADGQYENRKIWHNVVWVPAGEKGHGISVHALHAFGLEFNGDVDFDTQDFYGRSARANVVIKSAEGKWPEKNEVAFFYTDDQEPNKSAKKIVKAKNGKVPEEVGF